MAAPWTVLFELRVVEAAVRCVRVRWALAGAARRVALPMRVADAHDVRARHELVRNLLAGASDDLDVAACSMKAAELLALYGASANNPMLPVLSIRHVPDGDRPVRLALVLLERARGCAEQACLHVESCCLHLRTADDLLVVPTLPGVDGMLDVERLMAHRDGVMAALGLARKSAALAITANWLVS